MPSPAEYSRYSHSHELQEFFGKRGEVISTGVVERDKAPINFLALAPYLMVLVRFQGGKMRTFMAMSGEKFEIGDEVECVVGANPADTDKGIIPYKIKVRHPIARLAAKQ